MGLSFLIEAVQQLNKSWALPASKQNNRNGPTWPVLSTSSATVPAGPCGEGGPEASAEEPARIGKGEGPPGCDTNSQ